MRAIRLGGPEADETARARLRSALKIDGTIWEAWYDLGAIAWQGGRRRRGDRRLRQGARDRPQPHVDPARARRGEPPRRPEEGSAGRLRGRAEDDGRRRSGPARCGRAARVAVARHRRLRRSRRDPARHRRTSGTNAKIYTELGQIYIAQKRLDLAQLVLAKARRARREGSLGLQRARAARTEAGQGAGGVQPVRSGRVARCQLHRRTLQQGVRAARRRRLRASQGRARGDRRKEARRLPGAGRARRRASRAQGAPGGEEGLAARDQGSPEAQHRPRRRDVEPRGARAGLLGRGRRRSGRRQGGSGALHARGPHGHSKRQDAENKCKEVKCR